MSKRVQVKMPAKCRRLEVDQQDLLNTDRGDLLQMLFLLHLVREFETTVLDFSENGLVWGPAHASVGQEAVAAGTAVALRKTDMVGSTHRAHGHFLAKAFVYYAPEGFDPLEESILPGTQEAVNQCTAAVRHNGTLVFYSWITQDVTLNISRWHNDSLEIINTGLVHHSVAERSLWTPLALRPVIQNQIQLKPLITHAYSLDKIVDAFETARTDPAAIKVVVRPDPKN